MTTVLDELESRVPYSAKSDVAALQNWAARNQYLNPNSVRKHLRAALCEVPVHRDYSTGNAVADQFSCAVDALGYFAFANDDLSEHAARAHVRTVFPKGFQCRGRGAPAIPSLEDLYSSEIAALSAKARDHIAKYCFLANFDPGDAISDILLPLKLHPGQPANFSRSNCTFNKDPNMNDPFIPTATLACEPKLPADAAISQARSMLGRAAHCANYADLLSNSSYHVSLTDRSLGYATACPETPYAGVASLSAYQDERAIMDKLTADIRELVTKAGDDLRAVAVKLLSPQLPDVVEVPVAKKGRGRAKK